MTRIGGTWTLSFKALRLTWAGLICSIFIGVAWASSDNAPRV